DLRGKDDRLGASREPALASFEPVRAELEHGVRIARLTGWSVGRQERIHRKVRDRPKTNYSTEAILPRVSGWKRSKRARIAAPRRWETRRSARIAASGCSGTPTAA